MLIEIFKAGRHTDSSGNTRAWTEGELDAIVQKYNPAEHEAPVVIGHPKDNAPAFGWVEGLERKGSVLYARLKDLVPGFVDAVKQGLYKKRSISLYPDMTLRHVGFLGAVPPAVKGLRDVAFGDSEESGVMSYEFSDYRISVIGGILQRIREFIIDKFDTETADKVISSYEIEAIQSEPAEPATASAFSENTDKGGKEMDKIQELEAKLKEEQQSRSAIEQQFSEKEKEAQALKQEIEKGMAEKRRAGFDSFCEGLMKEGRLLPAKRPVVMDFMEILFKAECGMQNAEYEFSEGDKKVKERPTERFKDFLNSLPKQVEFGETATKDKAAEGRGKGAGHDFSGKVDEERLELHNKAISYIEANKGVSYKDALEIVLREDK